MCVDANAGARAAARERAAQKDALFAQEGLKFFNKETQLARTQKRNVVGYSRDLSDAYAGALAAQGKGRKRVETAARKYFRAKGTVNEGGRSRRFGTAQLQGYLAAQSEVESVIDNVLRRNMAYATEGAKRKFQAAQAQGREALGIPAAYGAPVMMPPTNRLGGALQVASQVASIATGISSSAGLFNFGQTPSVPTGGGGGLSFGDAVGTGGLGIFDYDDFSGAMSGNPFS